MARNNSKKATWKKIGRKTSRIGLLVFASLSILLCGCTTDNEIISSNSSRSYFSNVGEYKVIVPIMQISALSEHYPAVANDTTTYSDFIFDKQTGLLKSMKINGDGSGTSEFKYDTDERLISASNGGNEIFITYNDNGLPDCFHYKIDKNGYVTKAYTSGGDVSRTFKNLENGLIESYSERIKPSYSGELRKDTFTVRYDIYGNIISTTGKNVTREYSYKKEFLKTYTPEENEELNPSSKWEAFNECRIIPTPDSCINTIKKDDSSNGGKYVYILPGKSEFQLKNQITIGLFDYCFGAYCPKPKGSDEIYFEYLSILKDVCGIELSVNDDGNTLMSDSDGNRLGILCYKQVSGKGSCLEIRFI